MDETIMRLNTAKSGGGKCRWIFVKPIKFKYHNQSKFSDYRIIHNLPQNAVLPSIVYAPVNAYMIQRYKAIRDLLDKPFKLCVMTRPIKEQETYQE